MERRDKNYNIITIGAQVDVPEIEGNVPNSFTGTVIDFNRSDDYVVVEDQDGDVFCVEPELLELATRTGSTMG